MKQLKQTIRDQMIARRSALTELERKRAESNIGANFAGTIPKWSGDVIAGYNAMRGEVNIRLLLESMIEQGFAVALPRITGKSDSLEFRRIDKTTQLVLSSKYGVYEPPESCKIVQPNIIIVPLLAFDSKGYRIGYGGGYYDRTLAEFSDSSEFISVGVGFSFQQISDVPHEEHDIRLDCVVTEKEVVLTSDLEE